LVVSAWLRIRAIVGGHPKGGGSEAAGVAKPPS